MEEDASRSNSDDEKRNELLESCIKSETRKNDIFSEDFQKKLLKDIRRLPEELRFHIKNYALLYGWRKKNRNDVYRMQTKEINLDRNRMSIQYTGPHTVYFSCGLSRYATNSQLFDIVVNQARLSTLKKTFNVVRQSLKSSNEEMPISESVSWTEDGQGNVLFCPWSWRGGNNEVRVVRCSSNQRTANQMKLVGTLKAYGGPRGIIAAHKGRFCVVSNSVVGKDHLLEETIEIGDLQNRDSETGYIPLMHISIPNEVLSERINDTGEKVYDTYKVYGIKKVSFITKSVLLCLDDKGQLFSLSLPKNLFSDQKNGILSVPWSIQKMNAPYIEHYAFKLYDFFWSDPHKKLFFAFELVGKDRILDKNWGPYFLFHACLKKNKNEEKNMKMNLIQSYLRKIEAVFIAQDGTLAVQVADTSKGASKDAKEIALFIGYEQKLIQLMSQSKNIFNQMTAEEKNGLSKDYLNSVKSIPDSVDLIPVYVKGLLEQIDKDAYCTANEEGKKIIFPSDKDENREGYIPISKIIDPSIFDDKQQCKNFVCHRVRAYKQEHRNLLLSNMHALNASICTHVFTTMPRDNQLSFSYSYNASRESNQNSHVLPSTNVLQANISSSGHVPHHTSTVAVMKKRILIGGVAAILCGIGGYAGYKFLQHYSVTEATPPPSVPLPVSGSYLTRVGSWIKSAFISLFSFGV